MAIYGYIESALLWYKILSTALEGLGFEINPYGIRVSNNIFKGKQCTICWYVDNTNLSYKNP